MDCVDTPPQSVFNTQNAEMVKFLERQWSKHQGGEKILLYPHQVEAVLRLRDYFNPGSSQSSNIALVVLPTGCGKTGVAVLASYALNATRVLVITPSIIISKQIDLAYRNFLIERGVISPKDVQRAVPTTSFIKKSSEIKEGMKSTVMVVNAHKIGGQSSVSIEKIPDDGYDLVIVDEAHHYPAPTWKLLVDHFKNSKRLFLTATPEHNGEPILPGIPCYQLERHEAVERGIIREVRFDEGTGNDTDEYHRYVVSYHHCLRSWLYVIENPYMVLTVLLSLKNSKTENFHCA